MTRTGGRDATLAVIPGRIAISVGRPTLPEPPGFAWRALTEVARLESGHTPARKRDDYWDGDIPWIGIRDATGNHGRIIEATNEYVTQAGIDGSSARVLPAGTVCLSRTASVGFVVQMGRPMATSQDFVNWVCGPELNPAYLRYVLMLEQESIRRFAHGTTHQTMYYPEAKALHILLPARSAQDAIVELLTAFDDKMATNRRVLDRCVALSDAHFERLHASEPSTPATYEDVASVLGGGTPKTTEPGFWGGGVPWATPTDVTNLEGPYLVSTARTLTDDGLRACASGLYPAGSILMTSRATIGAFAIAQAPVAVNQGFIVVNAADPSLQWWLYHDMRTRVDEFLSYANGATFLELSRGSFRKLPVTIPDSSVVHMFRDLVAPLHEVAGQVMIENRALEAMRDEVLPLVLSGAVAPQQAVGVGRSI